MSAIVKPKYRIEVMDRRSEWIFRYLISCLFIRTRPNPTDLGKRINAMPKLGKTMRTLEKEEDTPFVLPSWAR